jgi:uncharacterized membrane protein
MEKFEEFIAKNGRYIVILLLLLIYVKSCNSDNNSEFNRKSLKEINNRIDRLPTYKDLQIEGLKNEKRMIQSTNRRILDVNRQTEIDLEITKLRSDSSK